MRPYYYSLNEYLRETFGEKLYKLSLDGGMTCPNRDGTLGFRGCIFCSAGGSGDFSGSRTGSGSRIDFSATPVLDSLEQQFVNARLRVSKKYHGSRYIAYFQAYTNTYAPVSYLRKLFFAVIQRPDVAVLSIATRPDCLEPAVICLLQELSRIKPVWVELGLQTIHKPTADYIRRGYELPVFEQAMQRLQAASIPVVVHMILGLPGEHTEDMLATADYIAHCKAAGIKLQLLHVLQGTDLADDYLRGTFSTLSMEEYFYLLGRILPLLPPDMVIHRLTGDGPKSLLLAPAWSTDKKNVMNRMTAYFREHSIKQGRDYQ